jgi:hypothetical protein
VLSLGIDFVCLFLRLLKDKVDHLSYLSVGVHFLKMLKAISLAIQITSALMLKLIGDPSKSCCRQNDTEGVPAVFLT